MRECRSSKTGYSANAVFRFAAGYWLRQPIRFSVILCLITSSASLETGLPNALSSVFESVRIHDKSQEVIFRLLIFAGIYFGHSMLFTLAVRVYNVFENNTFKALLDDAFEHVQSLSEQFLVNSFAGSIITTFKRGRDRIETFQDQILLDLLPTFLIIIGSISLLAFRFPVLAMILSVYLAVLMVVSATLVLRYVGPAQETYANAQDAFGAHLADTITGIVTTKSYAQERHEVRGFKTVTDSLRVKNLDSYLKTNDSSLVQRLLLGGMLVLLLGGGVWYFLCGVATMDDMAYLVMAYSILQSHIRIVGDNIKNLLTASYDLHGVMALMALHSSVQDRPGAKDLSISQGIIELRNVTFTYPGKNTAVFEDICVTIRQGERVALVGASGSGKTSLVRLIQRMYDVDVGRVLIDGQDVSEVTQLSLRSAIAVVPQDPILFHRSLRDNISYGKLDASLEEVREAARQANIDDFIMSSPQQYDTMVGERGIKLSGGERQRVAIARAILSDRRILILDEATSSLDSASERAVQEAIYAVTYGRTCVMIAHRLSTVRGADRILVFHNGRIAEEGRHEELVARKNGIYAEFYEIQSFGFGAPPACVMQP